MSKLESERLAWLQAIRLANVQGLQARQTTPSSPGETARSETDAIATRDQMR
jgi:hypothetical protein